MRSFCLYAQLRIVCVYIFVRISSYVYLWEFVFVIYIYLWESTSMYVYLWQFCVCYIYYMYIYIYIYLSVMYICENFCVSAYVYLREFCVYICIFVRILFLYMYNCENCATFFHPNWGFLCPTEAGPGIVKSQSYCKFLVEEPEGSTALLDTILSQMHSLFGLHVNVFRHPSQHLCIRYLSSPLSA
jgi:hypothetical protein